MKEKQLRQCVLNLKRKIYTKLVWFACTYSSHAKWLSFYAFIIEQMFPSLLFSSYATSFFNHLKFCYKKCEITAFWHVLLIVKPKCTAVWC